MLMAVGAYVSWGLLPVYWKLLKHVPTPELMSHRVAWSFVTLVVFLGLTRRLAGLLRRLDARVWRGGLMAALLIGTNWTTYVWSVNAGYIVEASLGYFITPLLSVLLGVFVLHERLRPLQWIPLGLAAAGVVYLTVHYGRLPWIALILSSTFSLYGLVKKKSSLGAFEGLTLETGILLLPALAVLGWSEFRDAGMFLRAGAVSDLLLVAAGAATVAPLAMFSRAARRIPLSMIGVMQYIAPTLQFLLGVFLYREPFTGAQFVGFCMVWTALALFLLERWRFSRALRRLA
jgi:chloramphenicol-sensitive protein RarD